MDLAVAPRIEMETVRSGYADLCAFLREHGRHVSPRGVGCREVTGATLVVHQPHVDAMPVGIGRKLNPAIGAVEALQLVGGVSHPDLMSRVTPNFDAFKDGGSFHGAYGPRIRWQLPEVVRRLRDDPDTRQAILQIWDPAYDVWSNPRDLPCTLGFQFLLRDGKLELHTTMRSNDVWWGWAYDAFQFTQLQMVVADALGTDVGTYVHRVGSLHLYDRDVEDSVRLRHPSTEKPMLTASLKLQFSGERDIADHQELARSLLAGESKVPATAVLSGWFVTTLERYFR